ncbi:hypothetical protein [Deinococcus altitudinis]|uniref:hypothetical protein n=1 Tax=Deinococcus altitudinis TaxID=468914 RepID=UPI003891CFEC
MSATTPVGCEDAVEGWLEVFRAADRFYDEVSTRFYIINGLPTLVRDKRKGRTTKHIEVDWPLLDPYFHEVDGNGNVIPGSTRLSP